MDLFIDIAVGCALGMTALFWLAVGVAKLPRPVRLFLGRSVRFVFLAGGILLLVALVAAPVYWVARSGGLLTGIVLFGVIYLGSKLDAVRTAQRGSTR